MPPNPPIPFDCESLLQRHGGALRALARTLLRDANDADDAVQETWHRALRSPPRHGARLDAWCAQVLRNVVRRLRRGDARRRRHELAAAVAGIDEKRSAGERTGTTRRLLAALDSLDAPYRDAIWQRYFEGLPPRAIAAATGVPLATVKSRLQRGLAMLRERLAQRDAGEWRGALAIAFGTRDGVAPAAAAIASTTGGVLVATWSKVAAAAAVVAFVWLVAWPALDPGVPSAPGAAATAQAVGADASADPDASTAGRRESAAGSEDAAAAVAGAGEPPAPARRRGRVVDAATKQPLAGAVVSVGYGMRLAPEPGDERQTTGVDGRFDFVFAAGREPRCWIECPGYVRVWWNGSPLAAGQVDEVGDVPVRVGRRLAGRVVDARGAPVSAVTVAVTYPSQLAGAWSDSGRVDAVTDARGTFVLEPAIGLGEAHFTLRSDVLTLAGAPVAAVVDASEPAEIELVAVERASIRGVVVGEHGAPLENVALGKHAALCDVRTAADGSFCLRRGDGSAESCNLCVADAPDYVPAPPRRVAWGTTGVRIELARAAVLPVLVVDDRGAPVEQFGVALQREGLSGAPYGTVRSRGTHAEGRCKVRGIVPGATSLRVVPVDDALTPSEVMPIVGTEPLRVVLARRRQVAVEVRRGGRPLAGVLVETAFADGGEPAKLQPVLLLDPHRGATAWLPNGGAERIAAAHTDANGVARLRTDAATTGRWLRVHAGSHVPVVVREPVFPPDGSPLRIDVPGVGAIAGRIEMRGRSREDVAVVLHAGDERRVVRPQPDGTLRCELLTAGSWQVELVLGGPLPESRRTVDVHDGATTGVAFDLAAFAPAAVDGRLLLADGPIENATMQLWRTGVQQRPELLRAAALAADGGFVAEDLLAGTYRLAVRVQGPDALVPALSAETFVLAAGERLALQLPFTRRRLVVRLQHANGTAVRGEQVVARCDGVQWPSFALSAPKVEDVLVLDPAPALPIELRLLASTGWSAPFTMPPDRAEAEVTVVLR